MGTTTSGTLPVPPLLGALGYHMPYCLAPIASGDAVMRICVMEDGHFHSPPSARWEWDNSPNDSGCLHKGRPDWGVARAYWNWVDKVVLAVQFLICIANVTSLGY